MSDVTFGILIQFDKINQNGDEMAAANHSFEHSTALFDMKARSCFLL